MLIHSPDTGFVNFQIENGEIHLRNLIKVIPWKQFYRTNRYVCSVGKSYRYSGQITEGIPFDVYPPLGHLLQRVNQHFGTNFNSILLNWYPQGTYVGIGKHSDDETELVSGQPVFSLSLGEETPFILKSKTTDEYRTVILRHGDAFMMGVDCQRYYTHECPYLMMNGDRISLTFREFK